MAKFLSTTSLSFYLEELIKKTPKNLVLVSPYLKINHRIRELLEDKANTGVTVRIVYGKTELSRTEIEWLRTQKHIEVSYCDNLHAKCYLNDANAIVTSMNLYEFSQVNNNEMGILVTKSKDADAFQEAFEEVSRLLRISERVTFSEEEMEASELEDSGLDAGDTDSDNASNSDTAGKAYDLLTTSKLAKAHKLTTTQATERLMELGYLEDKDGYTSLTKAGKAAGGRFKKGKHGIFFLWPHTTLSDS